MRGKIKRLITFSFGIALTIMLSFFWSCEETSHDPCDDTVEPEKAVTLKVTAHILTLRNNPVVDQPIKIQTFKVPCGADRKGEFKFEGVTNSNGIFYGSLVGYNLRNSKDEVVASAIAPDLENFHEQNFAQAIFKYDNLSSIGTKEVHLYIYAKDPE
jgi:hypothetical protein